MDTNELTELMKDEWQDQDIPKNLDIFLTISHSAYLEKQPLKDLIDWTALKTIHAWEKLGNCCYLVDGALERLERGERLSENGAPGPGIQLFRTDENFRGFCHQALREFQERARRQMEKGKKPVASKEERERQTRQESEKDVLNTYSKVRELQKQAKEYAQSALRLQRKTEQLKIEARNAQHAAESIIPNMLTTLGIFIAIVVAVVGCYLSLIFNKHQDPGFPVLNLSVCLLMGHILLDVIFLLMYLISKQTNYIIACYCHIGDQMDCSKCPQKIRLVCKFQNRIWLRYPYVILLNGMFLLSYAVLGLWHFLRSYLGNQIDQIFYGEPRAVIGFSVVLVVLALWIIRKIFLFLTPGEKLREVMSEQSKDTGLTAEQMDLKHQVSDMAERLEKVEALYEGRGDVARKTVGAGDDE